MCAMRSTGVLQRTAANVKNDIQDILQSGNYYITEELARELSVINNAVEHLTLDDTFLATSSDWQKKPGNFSSSETNDHLSHALSALNKAGSCLYEYKNRLANRALADKQENQIRELHQWAASTLRESQMDLDAFTNDSANRIKQFGDTIGVTDRYTGFRQNLTRGSRDPFCMESSWVDKPAQQGRMNSLVRSHTTIGSPSLEQRGMVRSKTTLGGCSGDASRFGAVAQSNIGTLKKAVTFEPLCQPMRVNRGYRTIDSLYPKGAGGMAVGAPRQSIAIDEVRHLNARNAMDQQCNNDMRCSTMSRPKQPYEMMSVQEQAGINTTFPGRTEYMQRYKAPDSNVPTCDFLINPSPNFAIYGRPMQRAVYIPSFTEYQTRYEWPDAEKIVKMPWLRN